MSLLVRPHWRIVAFALACAFSSSLNAQQFGRFFTTAEERGRLEALRRTTPKPDETMAADAIPVAEREIPAQSPPAIDRVRLKGVVYRAGGPHTAWVNNSNTYEGGLPMAYMKVAKGDIGPGHVTVELPTTQDPVKLKVGQSYDLQSGLLFDVMNTPPGDGGAAGDENAPAGPGR